MNLNMFPVAGVPTGDAPADEDEHAVADDATRSGVSGPKSAARRSAQYGEMAGADPEDVTGPLAAASREEGEGARSKSARLDPVRLGMNLSL